MAASFPRKRESRRIKPGAYVLNSLDARLRGHDEPQPLKISLTE